MFSEGKTPIFDLFSTEFGLFPLGKSPEKRHMGKFMEFAEVLEKKIRRQIENDNASSTRPTENPRLNDELPSGFAWILGQGPVLKVTGTVKGPGQKKGHQAYGVKAKPRPPHKLSASQKIAMQVFAARGSALSESYSKSELKTAWRRVAKSTHPDHGGTSQGFREAQAAYQSLSQVFAL